MSLATGTVVLLLQSRSDPWLIGGQNEPYWSWAVGSGRLKVWIAEPGTSSAYDTWTSSWYRGLDGQPIRWDFTFHRGSTGGVVVMALPLGPFVGVCGICGVSLLWLGRRQREPNHDAHARAGDRWKSRSI